MRRSLSCVHVYVVMVTSVLKVKTESWNRKLTLINCVGFMLGLYRRRHRVHVQSSKSLSPCYVMLHQVLFISDWQFLKASSLARACPIQPPSIAGLLLFCGCRWKIRGPAYAEGWCGNRKCADESCAAILPGGIAPYTAPWCCRDWQQQPQWGKSHVTVPLFAGLLVVLNDAIFQRAVAHLKTLMGIWFIYVAPKIASTTRG